MAERHVIYLALFCVLAFNGINCSPLTGLKGAAKSLTDKVGDVASKVAPVEQTGGVRQTALHAGVDLAYEKGLELVGARYPALKVAGKLAKPAMNKVHGKINNMFKKPEATVEQDSKVADQPENERDEPQPQQKEENGAKEEAQVGDPSAQSDHSGNQNEVDKKPAEEPKKGVMGKIKSLVKGTGDKDEHENKAGEVADDADGEEEKGKKKEGIVGKLKSLVHGESKPEENDKVQTDSKAAQSGDDQDAKKEPNEEKEGVLSKLGNLVTGDKKSNDDEKAEKKESPKKE